MDSRLMQPAGPLIQCGVEGSGEQSATTPMQIADNSTGSKRIRLETAACSVKKDTPDYGLTPSSEMYTEGLRKFLTSAEGVDKTVADNLFKCCGDVDALRLLSNLDARAPLCTAVKNKHYPVAQLLIGLKADVNALDEDRKPPLYYAIQNVDVKMTKLLLNNGAIVKNSRELLHLAASKKSIEIVEALLQQGVDVNVKDGVGNTVLHLAVSTACEAILKSERATETDSTNTSSICIEFSVMFYLLSRFNVNVNLANDEGSTPLHISARNGNVKISTLLLNKGAVVSTADQYRNTPLHLAVTEGHADIVKLLVERGARLLCFNMSFLSPLHLACERGYTKIVDTLLAYDDCVDVQTDHLDTPLHLAVKGNHADVVKLLLDKGAHVNLGNDTGLSPLHYATNNNDKAITDILLKSDACIDAKTRKGLTPLHVAVGLGYEKLVEKLLKWGANVNCSDNYGGTPLSSAAWAGNSTIIEVLLVKGACVNAIGEGGKTPLHTASKAGHASAVATLLDNGADISMKCGESSSPFDYARGSVISRRRETLDSLFRHQVKLEAAGLNPTASDSQVTQREEGLEDFYYECQLEIARMKSLFIASTNVTYFDIVKKDTRCVANYLKNKSIVLALECEDYKSEFPIYAGIIGFKFREAFPRTKLFERATQVFHRIRGWPEDCTAKVLDFLDDDNLKVFSDV